jgi:hypothetical protein
MPEQTPDPRWPERFTATAEHDPADWFDPREDLERGRAALRRRRVLMTSSSVLAATVVLGIALVVSGGGSVRQSAPEPAAPKTPSPTFQESSVTLEPTPAPSTLAPKERRVKQAQRYAGLTASADWRNGLYDVVASVLDPQKRHLNYSTQSLQSGSDGSGGISMGIKLGWTMPGQPGEGMVQISLSDQAGESADESQIYLGAPMRDRSLAGGASVRVGERPDGAFAVSHRQPDGETVWVLVEPLFGGNSLEPVTGMEVSRADVFRLVQDERLDLPPH